MRKKGKIALICCIAAVPLLLIAAFLLFALPYIKAASSMPEGASLSLLETDEGSYTLSWTEGENAHSYRVLLTGTDGETLFETVADSAECAVSGISASSAEISVTPLGRYLILGGEHLREGEAMSVSVSLKSPSAPEVEWTPDDEVGTLTAVTEPHVGLGCELRLVEGEDERVLDSSDGDTLSVSFGGEDELPLPEYDEPYTFVVRAVVSGEGYTLTGLPSDEYELEREALLPDTSELTVEDSGVNRYSLSWTPAKGDYYEIQRAEIVRGETGEWTTLGTIECDDVLSYDTGTMSSCREYSFRVVGRDDGVEDGVSASGEETVTTERSSLYCTIWPLCEQAVYASADPASEKLEVTAKATTAYCVLGEENGLFKVRVDGVTGWIDSNYCLINLPEYLGSLLAYDITNSYASKYMIHGYEIPEVTDTVINGYENVRLAEGLYLVPYLYPCCEKLYNAANAALADGYRLKIYDSYRPRAATTYVYNAAEVIIDDPLPETDFYGEVPEDLPQVAEGEVLTYRRLVTEGSYGLPNFLAQSGSMHNMGIALDLTMEHADTGEELEMQTDMHDLSIYSIISRNNSQAVLLDGYMKAAGFGGLTSEWWHFQDNETRTSLGLNIYMQYGVSCEGWTADDNGWRYRRADGSFVTDGTAEIGGVSYSFDADGYCETDETE